MMISNQKTWFHSFMLHYRLNENTYHSFIEVNYQARPPQHLLTWLGATGLQSKKIDAIRSSSTPPATRDWAKLFVQALIMSHLGFCNSPQPIQITENTAVCLLFILPKVSNIKLFLHTLHWLLILWQLVVNSKLHISCRFLVFIT